MLWEVQGRLFLAQVISDQARKQGDQEIGDAAMAGVLDLGAIFQLVVDGLDNAPFAQQKLVGLGIILSSKAATSPPVNFHLT